MHDTVDHIMPQGERLPEAWKAELGPDWAQVWHTWRHTRWLASRRCSLVDAHFHQIKK